MKATVNKRMIFKRLMAFNILLFSSLCSMAGFADKVKNTVSKEFNSFEGIWIMLGLIGGGLGLYVVMNFINKRQASKEAAEEAANPHLHQHHHRHRHRKVVKK